MFLIFTKEFKLIYKTGNGVSQTGNGIMSLTSRHLIKILFNKMFLIFTKDCKKDFQNRKWIYPNRLNYIAHFRTSDL